MSRTINLATKHNSHRGVLQVKLLSFNSNSVDNLRRRSHPCGKGELFFSMVFLCCLCCVFVDFQTFLQQLVADREGAHESQDIPEVAASMHEQSVFEHGSAQAVS